MDIRIPTSLFFLTTYLLGTFVFLIIFSEFSAFDTILAMVIYLGLPVLSNLQARKRFRFYEKKALLNTFVAYSVISALSISILAFVSTDGRMEYHPFDTLVSFLAGTLHEDTAMHSAIINSIVRVGYPSTALHGTEFLPYHTATHYFDSIFIYLSKQNALDVYGYITFIKTVALILTIFGLSSKLVIKGNALNLSLHFFIALTLLFFTGGIISSHSLWLPSVLLILLWPHIQKLLFQKPSTKNLISLFLIGLILSFGKISLGLSFMAILGLSIFFQNVKDVKVILLGILWLFFLYLYSSFFEGRQGISRITLIDYLSVYKYALILFLMCLAISFYHKNGVCRKMVVPILIYFILSIAVSTIIVRFESDLFYFMTGLLFMASLAFLSDIDYIFSTSKKVILKLPETFNLQKKENSPKTKHSLSQKFNIQVPVKFLLMILAIFPTLMFLNFSPISIQNLKLLNVYPYRIPNEIIQSQGGEVGESVARTIKKIFIYRELPHRKIYKEDMIILRSRLHEFVEENNLQEAPLFLSISDWDNIRDVMSEYPGNPEWRNFYAHSSPWIMSLYISAFLNTTLLHSIPHEYPIYYGFYYYNKNAYYCLECKPDIINSQDYFYHERGRRIVKGTKMDCLSFTKYISLVSLRDYEFKINDCSS